MTLEFDAAMRLGSFDYEAQFEAHNEIVVLFGHSGAGKSVTLQIAAGLLKPARGHIVIDGTEVFDSNAGTNLPPQDRCVGYVVQELALFPHMSVAQNVGFAVPKGQDKAKRVSELLTLFNIGEFGDRKPNTLSGGQRQRVALARALARDARLLLLDEPFSALDDSLRASLRRELLRLRRELGLSIVFVTHDLREAHLLADRLAVFDGGRLLQFAAREEVFRRPLNHRVAQLTGVSNIFEGRVVAVSEASTTVEVNGLCITCACAPEAGVGSVVDVCIRAERVILRRIGAEEAPNLLTATIVEEFAYGATHTLRLTPDGAGPALEVELAARPYEVLGVAGQKTWTVELPEADLHVMPRGS
ncbi:MAG: ABC transporter ATP-binding protein [Tepidiformaceae bacterium]